MATDLDSVFLTTEEIAHLCRVLDVDLPVGLSESWDLITPERREAVLESAEAVLTERRILADGEVAVPIATMVRAFAEPALVGMAGLELASTMLTRSYAVDAGLGIEHEGLTPSIHRLAPFMPAELLDRVQAFVDLRPAEPPDVEPFEVVGSTLDAVIAGVDGGDTEAATTTLADAGVATASADPFVRALTTRRANAVVSMFYRPDEDTTAGGQLFWIDTGLRGNWVIEPLNDDDDPPVRVRPETAQWIADELTAYLPGPLVSAEA